MSSKFSGLALATESTARMPIINPMTAQPIRDADGNDAYIEIAYAQCAVGAAHDRAVIDKRMRIMASGGRYSQEMVDADANEKLAKLTRGWRLIGLDGQAIPIDCSEANARELYREPTLGWVRDQVVLFSVNLGNFQAAASTA